MSKPSVGKTGSGGNAPSTVGTKGNTKSGESKSGGMHDFMPSPSTYPGRVGGTTGGSTGASTGGRNKIPFLPDKPE